MRDTDIELMLMNAIARAGQSLAAALPAKEEPDVLLTACEVAETLQIGKNAVYNLIQRGVLPGMKLNGQFKVRRRALEAWMSSMDGMDLTDPLHPVPLLRTAI